MAPYKSTKNHPKKSVLALQGLRVLGKSTIPVLLYLKSSFPHYPQMLVLGYLRLTPPLNACVSIEERSHMLNQSRGRKKGRGS